MFSLHLRLSVGLAFAAVGVVAQTTNATCQPGWQWASNSRGQSPCLIASYLQAACNNGQFNVLALPADSHYTGPTQDNQTPCKCSTVTYSLMSACGSCQNAEIISWSSWQTNCTAGVFVKTFPQNVPSGTVVPGWAYLDVTQKDIWSATDSQNAASLPESSASAGGNPTGSLTSNGASSTGTAGTQPTGGASNGPGSSGGSSGSGKKSNAGAIAGGVVGGLVGLALIGLLAFLFLRRRRQHRQTAVAAGSHGPVDLNSQPATPYHNSFNQPGSPPPMAAVNTGNTYGSGAPLTGPQRLYDPNDPSTFPSPAPAHSGYTGQTNWSGPTDNTGYNAPHHQGGYSGAPEL